MRPINFSLLKHLAKSPAHYKHATEHPFEPTASMRLGTIVHAIVLGARAGREIVVYEGTRRGKAWEDFKAAHEGREIVTASEHEDAQPIAASVLADPVARPLIDGARKEVPLAWYDAGIQCATSGVDLLGGDYLADLKTTQTTEPRQWERVALRMHYHAQLAFYRRGALANGLAPKDFYLIGVETAAPYPVTVLRLPAPVMEAGDKLITLWLERLRVCEETDTWPGYTQTAIDVVLPEWLTEEAGSDDA